MCQEKTSGTKEIAFVELLNDFYLDQLVNTARRDNILDLGYVHTNPFSYASVFDPTKTDTNIRVHTSVFDRPHTFSDS